MNKDDLTAGMRVWVHSGHGGRHGREWRGEIVHIARLLVTIADVMREGEEGEYLSRRPEKYRIDDQHAPDKGYSSRPWFETGEQRAQRKHDREVSEYLSSAGVEFSGSKARVTQEHRERIAVLLRELGYTTGTALEQAHDRAE